MHILESQVLNSFSTSLKDVLMMDQPYMMIGYWSAWHWIAFVLFVTLLLYPIGRILARIGFSPLWSIIALVPLANLVGLWIVALQEWPRDRPGSR